MCSPLRIDGSARPGAKVREKFIHLTSASRANLPVSRASSRFWYEVYRMEEDKKERAEMLADESSPIWATVLGGATLEDLFQVSRKGLFMQGIPLSRAGFLACRGIAFLTPKSLVQLAKLGVEVIGFQVVAVEPERQRGIEITK